MKNTIFLIMSTTFLLFSCGNQEEKKETVEETKTDSVKVETEVYKAGQDINEDGAISAEQFLEQIKGKDSLEVKLTAKINAVCQKKGCWMRLDLGNGEEMTVKFKDYEFFVPKDASGQTAIVQGWAKVNTISVEELKELAEDDGQSKEEIAAIKEPSTELTFLASGVLIKK